MLEFLDDFEQAALASKLSDSEKCSHVCRYATFEVRKLWILLPEYTSQNWSAFKAAVLEMYPEADDSHKYTLLRLRKFVKERNGKPFTSLEEFGTFHREFKMISLTLQKNQSGHELDYYYLSAVGKEEEQAIRDMLEDQKKHRHRNFDRHPITMAEARECFVRRFRSMNLL